jgi:putative oxidoreductase
MFNDMIERNRDLLILIARVLLMALFLISGWSKLTDFQGTAGYLASIGTPVPSVAAAIAVLMEVVVAIALLVGIFVRPLALLMALFVLGTGLLGHAFWGMEGTDQASNMTQFYKNLAIMGGLVLLAVTGPGRFAAMRR